MRISYLGHASLLIEIGGLKILTDPLLRRRVMHLRRVAPDATAEQLAGVGLILISHAHHDHLDTALAEAARRRPAACSVPSRRAGRSRARG